MGWSFGGDGSYNKLLEIQDWSGLGFGDTDRQFDSCNYLKITAVDIPDLSRTTSLESAFSNCHSITTIPSINRWDTSNVTDMSGMFNYAEFFNQDLSGWDTSKVETMKQMFMHATSFDQNISDWNISNVTTMDNMFNYITLSTANYDAILIAWAAQDVQNDVVFHGGGSKYSAAAASAHQSLIDKGWKITDGKQEK